jgi:hypothetical protein
MVMNVQTYFAKEEQKCSCWKIVKFVYNNKQKRRYKSVFLLPLVEACIPCTAIYVRL